MAYPAVLTEARRLRKLGLACTGIVIGCKPNGSKDIRFHTGWQNTSVDNSTETIAEQDNGLILITGDNSDVIALDIDRAKPDDISAGRLDGLHVMEALIQRHGMPPVPTQMSGNRGKHLLFSLSKSLQQGLQLAKNQTKLSVNGQEVTLDIRADRGCLIVAPSRYETHDGVVKQYQWLIPLCSRDEMPCMPDWLITLVNSGGRKASQLGCVKTPKRHRELSLTRDDPYYPLTVDTVRELCGTVDRWWPRDNGYDFSPADRSKPCPLCHNLHTSNNFIVRRIISTCFKLASYGSNCRVRVCGEQDVKALQDLAASPTSDDRIVRILQLITRDLGHELVYTGKQWLWFQGLIWEPVDDIEVKHRIKVNVNYAVIETLIKCLRAGGTKQNPSDPLDLLTALKKTNTFLMKAASINSVAETAKHLLLNQEISKHLDTNKDIIAAANGVIDLPTGELRPARQHDHLARFVHTDYRGLDHPTPTIDALFSSIFNDDQEVVSYMQRLLGYGITGYSSNHKWAIWIGGGGNGKSLLLDCISNLLGPDMFCTPAKEVFFQTGRQGTAGGHTAHLQPLINKLIVAREESNEGDVLDTALIKQTTGESAITTRAPYSSEWVTFVPTHLPILCCNALPKINVDDEGTLRRLIVVPFVNQYLGTHDRIPYDPANPHHRLKDPNLRDKLSSDGSKQQLFAWLVKGAKQWFDNGRELGEQPALLRNRLEQYIADNDVLHQFIVDHCEQGRDMRVKKDDFREAFVRTAGRDVKQNVLELMMTKRGFPPRQAKMSGVKCKVYIGLQFSRSGN